MSEWVKGEEGWRGEGGRGRGTYAVNTFEHPNTQRQTPQIHSVRASLLLRTHLRHRLQRTHSPHRGRCIRDRRRAVVPLQFINLFPVQSDDGERQRKRKREVGGGRTICSSSSSAGSRSSCTTSTTTRMRSRSLSERVRRTSRQRPRRPSGSMSWHIIVPSQYQNNTFKD